MEDLQLITGYNSNGIFIENFEETKQFLEDSVAMYKNIAYAPEDIKEAKKTKTHLSKLRSALDSRRKDIKKTYMEPYTVLEEKIKELIAIVDEPLQKVKDFIDEEETKTKESKHNGVMDFCIKESAVLGEFADVIITSDVFYEKSWDNQSSTMAKIHTEASEKIKRIASDISVIRNTNSMHTSAVLKKYMETLSMDGIKEYIEELESVAGFDKTVSPAITGDDDNVIGYRTIKLIGTERRMSEIFEMLELADVEYEIIEDGMPKTFEELSKPSFDSFVAFDIETSGTFGVASGDGPSEITEIGAVRVVNGVITERFSELCNPGRKIVPRVARLTGISDEMVADKPSVNEIIKKFADFIGNDILVGHNIKHSDLGYISRAAKKAGVVIDNEFFDTYLYAKQFRETNAWENVRLEYLSKQLGIEQNSAHRAWCDAEANVGVYFKLKEM